MGQGRLGGSGVHCLLDGLGIIHLLWDIKQNDVGFGPFGAKNWVRFT